MLNIRKNTCGKYEQTSDRCLFQENVCRFNSSFFFSWVVSDCWDFVCFCFNLFTQSRLISCSFSFAQLECSKYVWMLTHAVVCMKLSPSLCSSIENMEREKFHRAVWDIWLQLSFGDPFVFFVKHSTDFILLVFSLVLSNFSLLSSQSNTPVELFLSFLTKQTVEITQNAVYFVQLENWWIIVHLTCIYLAVIVCVCVWAPIEFFLIW